MNVFPAMLREYTGPYSFDHCRYCRHACSFGICKVLPMRGSPLGPDGSGKSSLEIILRYTITSNGAANSRPTLKLKYIADIPLTQWTSNQMICDEMWSMCRRIKDARYRWPFEQPDNHMRRLLKGHICKLTNAASCDRFGSALLRLYRCTRFGMRLSLPEKCRVKLVDTGQ